MASEPVQMVGHAAGEIVAAAPQRQRLARGGQQRDRRHRARRQYPHILRALARQQRFFTAGTPDRHPCQAAPHHLVASGSGDREEAQQHRSGRHPFAVPARRDGAIDHLAAHPIPRPGPNAGYQFVPGSGGQQRRYKPLHTRTRHQRLNHQFRQHSQHTGQILRPPTPPRTGRGEQQLLPQQAPGHRRQKFDKAGRFHQPAAQRVGHRHARLPHRLHQARRAGQRRTVELQRIALPVGHPTQENIDRHQATERLEIDPVVAHRQVATFDQRVAQIAGEVGVLEIGRARRPWALQSDAGIFPARRQPLEHAAEGDEKGGQSLDMALAKHSRQQPRHHQPVFQTVAEAVRHAGPVSQHGPVSLTIARHHRGMEMEAAAAGRHSAVAAAQKAGMREDHLGGNQPFADHMLRSVEIGQEAVEQPGPLSDPPRENLPVGCRHHQRNGIKHPRPLLSERLVMHVVGDAVVPDQLAGLLPALDEFGRTPGSNLIGKPPPMGPGPAVGGAQFVIAALWNAVATEGTGCQRAANRGRKGGCHRLKKLRVARCRTIALAGCG